MELVVVHRGGSSKKLSFSWRREETHKAGVHEVGTLNIQNSGAGCYSYRGNVAWHVCRTCLSPKQYGSIEG